MTTIELRFPANRYHGNAWGRHVNEGVAEWPPSPYRLLRALYDIWKRKAPDLSQSDIEGVFRNLATSLPRFYGSEKIVAAHTRSYLNSNTTDPTDKSLIFDAFVSLAPNQSCWIEWETELTPTQRGILAELLAGLNYLGRSESWVEARIADTPASESLTCWPGHQDGRRGDLLYLACPVNPDFYRGKRSWLDALTYSTADIVKEKLSGPPAMQSIPYTLAKGVLTMSLPPRRTMVVPKASGALLQLTGNVLPNITEAIRVAERIRERLMAHFGPNAHDRIPALIHGKGKDGLPLKDHSHLFILPQANAFGSIERILLFARDRSGKPVEFNPDTLNSILHLDFLPWISGSGRAKRHPVRVATAWLGSHDDPKARPKRTRFRSITPFVTVRHWRQGRGSINDFLKEEIRRECRNQGQPDPITIKRLAKVGLYTPEQFRRARRDDPSRPGYFFELEFKDDMPGPFSLGYSCHFGLGQFEPV